MKKFQFPFGQPLKKVDQSDKSPKKAFVLGVYASAVHARWVDKEGKQVIAALAVASEPEIFWRGENAEDIISRIKIPQEAGKLVLPNKNMNGPSGKELDEKFLESLGLSRKDTWLCDLLPESRMNTNQKKAVNKRYMPLVNKYQLPVPTIPEFNKQELNSETRRLEILEELKQSHADTLILLGDLPIQWFLHFHENRYSKLSDFGNSKEEYGLEHPIIIDNKIYKVIPLCHPRQAGRLGTSSKKWGELHDHWMNRRKNGREFLPD